MVEINKFLKQLSSAARRLFTIFPGAKTGRRNAGYSITLAMIRTSEKSAHPRAFCRVAGLRQQGFTGFSPSPFRKVVAPPLPLRVVERMMKKRADLSPFSHHSLYRDEPDRGIPGSHRHANPFGTPSSPVGRLARRPKEGEPTAWGKHRPRAPCGSGADAPWPPCRPPAAESETWMARELRPGCESGRRSYSWRRHECCRW